MRDQKSSTNKRNKISHESDSSPLKMMGYVNIIKWICRAIQVCFLNIACTGADNMENTGRMQTW